MEYLTDSSFEDFKSVVKQCTGGEDAAKSNKECLITALKALTQEELCCLNHCLWVANIEADMEK